MTGVYIGYNDYPKVDITDDTKESETSHLDVK